MILYLQYLSPVRYFVWLEKKFEMKSLYVNLSDEVSGAGKLAQELCQELIKRGWQIYNDNAANKFILAAGWRSSAFQVRHQSRILMACLPEKKMTAAELANLPFWEHLARMRKPQTAQIKPEWFTLPTPTAEAEKEEL